MRRILLHLISCFLILLIDLRLDAQNMIIPSKNFNIIKLSKVKLKSLLKSKVHKEITTSIDKRIWFPFQKYYVLEDKRFLIEMFSGEGFMYESLQSLIDFITNPSQDPTPLVPEDFLERVPSLIQNLSELVKLPLSLSDNLKNLARVDAVLRKKKWKNLTQKEYVLPLVAYCGQIMINETNGVWSMKRELSSSQECQYLLNIKDLSKNPYEERLDPYILVTNQFADPPPRISFSDCIDSMIHPNNFLRLIEDKDKNN